MMISISSVYLETNVLKELKKAKTQKQVKDICNELKNIELEEIINTENKHYHELSKPRIPDLVFDYVREELEKRKPNSKALSQVGASIVGKKVKLPFSMGSLDKVKPSDTKLENWTQLFSGPYSVSDKLDGASLLYDCRDLKNPKLYTRGRENVGRDMSHLIPFLNLPRKPCVVRGELAMKQKSFSKHFSKETKGGEYENARNLVSSILTKKTADTSLLKRCHFIAHEMVYPESVPSTALAKLKNYGFDVVWHKTLNSVDSNILSNLLKMRKTISHFEIDGLVVTQDKKNTRPHSGNPLYSVAFKLTEDDAIKESIVLSVEWTVSKHSLAKPVLLIKPIRLAGVTVKRVTAHNAKTVKEKGIGPGAVITLTRSGDVIPKLLSVVKKVKWQEPDFPYTWDKNNTEIIASTEHASQKIKKIYSFFSTLGVDYLGEGIIEQLYTSGFTSIKKILKAEPKDFLKVEGFKVVKANKIYDSIKEKTTQVEFVKLLDAIGVFGKGFGERKLRPIVEAFPNLEKLALLPEKQIQLRIESLKGYSEISSLQFAQGLQKALDKIEKLGISWKKKEKTSPIGSSLKGKSFLFTGIRNKDCEDFIVSQQGTIATAVSDKLTALVAKDILSQSSKAQKARALNVPILTFDQFRAKYWKSQ
jgi:DNA ligase (NAD+)